MKEFIHGSRLEFRGNSDKAGRVGTLGLVWRVGRIKIIPPFSGHTKLCLLALQIVRIEKREWSRKNIARGHDQD